MKQKFFVRTINKKGIRLAPIPFFEAVMAEKSVSKSIKSLSCAPFAGCFLFLSGLGFYLDIYAGVFYNRDRCRAEKRAVIAVSGNFRLPCGSGKIEGVVPDYGIG